MTHETEELLNSPEKAFDSDIESAQKEARELAEQLQRIGKIERNSDRASFEVREIIDGQASQIQIAWPAQKGSKATMLRLTPHTEGRGKEKGIFGYSGEYGVTEEKSGQLEFLGTPISLKELFGIPKDLEIVVVPTADRWAIEKNGLLSEIYGEKTCTLYMGLGFLFRGQEFMHIGMHEAGHLPDNPDENKAWTFANQRYAKMHKPKKEEILSGRDAGLFGLLKRPERYGTSSTIGKIMSYGLISHSIDGKTRISAQWRKKKDEIMREFRDVIMAANDDYDYFIGR